MSLNSLDDDRTPQAPEEISRNGAWIAVGIAAVIAFMVLTAIFQALQAVAR